MLSSFEVHLGYHCPMPGAGLLGGLCLLRHMLCRVFSLVEMWGLTVLLFPGVQSLSNLAWACAKVDFYNEELFDTLAARACTSWGQLTQVLQLCRCVAHCSLSTTAIGKSAIASYAYILQWLRIARSMTVLSISVTLLWPRYAQVSLMWQPACCCWQRF